MNATALEVKEGDIVRCCGYRCRARNVKHTDGVARYTLHSAPLRGELPLPAEYEGMSSGGNSLALVTIERPDFN